MGTLAVPAANTTRSRIAVDNPFSILVPDILKLTFSARPFGPKTQNKNFKANWIRRGFVPCAELVTTPKFALFEEQQVVLGGEN
jgi:hypothetical protein